MHMEQDPLDHVSDQTEIKGGRTKAKGKSEVSIKFILPFHANQEMIIGAILQYAASPPGPRAVTMLKM